MENKKGGEIKVTIKRKKEKKKKKERKETLAIMK